jgi:hypothetical protein
VGLRPADRFEHDVGTEPVGQHHDPLHGVNRRRVEIDAETLEFVEIEETGYYSAEINDGDRIDGAAWESKAAFVADIAAESVLEERVPRWDEFDIAEVDQILTSLRSYMENCPMCDGELGIVTDVETGCCGAQDIYKLQCRTCESNLLRAGHA